MKKMEKTKIILVDDDIDLGDLISSSLISEGYEVHFQSSLAGIESIIEAFNPSILILDVEIGEDDGVTRAKNILQEFPSLPILFISSHTEAPDVARGVTVGGVGYIRKPFDMEELKAYIKRFALRIKTNGRITKIGHYTLNRQTRELHLRGVLMKQLSRLEFDVLQLLLANANDIVVYESLSKKIWNKKHSEVEHTLNNVISKLRKALHHTDAVDIQTIKDVGYKLRVKEES